ncbi:MAG: MFS transporter [Thermogemmatispora sp.]|uniref:MFS transporter n=1 Tax=Thermogemmatispora sp. TaxID=1968838 RepID=UPI00262508CB|nr:MFS transporter [Thermogemmatispora sp.]MBX5455747.1 MFS transporter [Thermogemmatispora sp.]
MNKVPKLNQAKAPVRRTPLVLILVITLLNTMGIAIMVPLVPFLVARNAVPGHNLAVVVGWLTATYGICQLLAAPGLGVLSDRFGRRPVLFLCLLGSVAGYLMLGLGHTLWLFFLGRIIDGLTGGNISILFGYVADLTEPEERGKYFGLLGSAAGIGSLLGPALAGLLATLNERAPFFAAAGLLLLALIWGYFVLPESLERRYRLSSFSIYELNPLKQLISALSWEDLRWLLLAWFLYAFPVGILQGTFTVLLKDSLNFTVTQVSLVLTVLGAVDILVQGLLIGWLLRKLGNIRLGLLALALVGASYLMLGSLTWLAMPGLALLGITLFASAGSCVENALRGLTSQAAGRQDQGRLSGAMQALQSLGWVAGPLVGGYLYTVWGHWQAYAFAALTTLLAIACVRLALPLLRGRVSQS